MRQSSITPRVTFFLALLDTTILVKINRTQNYNFIADAPTDTIHENKGTC